MIIVLFLSGPQEKVDTTIHVSVSQDLDEYLKKSEGNFKDIVPGTEKIISWRKPDKKNKTYYSILFFHGFSASRQEYVPVIDDLANGIDANIFYTRLNGHGRGEEPMGRATVNGWLNDGVEAIEIGKRIGDKNIIVCSSTGCTLAIWLATQEKWKKDISAIVMLSPNLMPKHPISKIAWLPWGKQILKLIIGDYREWKPENELQGKYWTHRYRTEVIYTMMKFVELVNDQDLKKFTIPLLLIYSENDGVISVPALKEKFKQFSSPNKQIIAFEKSADPYNHILAGDILSPQSNKEILELILKFIQDLPKE